MHILYLKKEEITQTKFPGVVYLIFLVYTVTV